MRTFSADIRDKTPATQRRLYTLFTKAVKAGEFPALKLLTRFELMGVKGPRQVMDYAYTEATAERVAEWLKASEKSAASNGYALAHVQHLTDDELTTLIQSQKVKAKPRRKKRPKSTPAPAASAE